MLHWVYSANYKINPKVFAAVIDYTITQNYSMLQLIPPSFSSFNDNTQPEQAGSLSYQK